MCDCLHGDAKLHLCIYWHALACICMYSCGYKLHVCVFYVYFLVFDVCVYECLLVYSCILKGMFAFICACTHEIFMFEKNELMKKLCYFIVFKKFKIYVNLFIS